NTPILKNFLHFLLLLILFLFSMGVFVLVMLLHVSSACQGRVRASRVHFTLDTKKDDTCHNRSTTSTPKQKKEKNKKGSDERGKIGQVESAPPTDIGGFFLRLLRLQTCELKATCLIVVLLIHPISK